MRVTCDVCGTKVDAAEMAGNGSCRKCAKEQDDQTKYFALRTSVKKKGKWVDLWYDSATGDWSDKRTDTCVLEDSTNLLSLQHENEESVLVLLDEDMELVVERI